MRTIIEMAREAGLYTKCEVHSAVPFDQLLERFAALVRANEREACAKVCNEIAEANNDTVILSGIATCCADAIRARENT